VVTIIFITTTTTTIITIIITTILSARFYAALVKLPISSTLHKYITMGLASLNLLEIMNY